MEVQVPKWSVKFEVGIEVGTCWGLTFPFEYDEDNNLVPKYDVIEDKELEVVEDKIEEVEIKEDDFTFNFDDINI